MRSDSRLVHRTFLLTLLAVALFLNSTCFATVTVTLNVSPKSPQAEGTLITFLAAGSDQDPGVISYRFSIAFVEKSLVIARDYSQQPIFQWTPNTLDGQYAIVVTARNDSTGSTAQAAKLFTVNSLVSSDTPVVSPTPNPLVALFSAPACASGSAMRVLFQLQGSATYDATNYLPCNPSSSMNFYVAGMRGNSTYFMESETTAGVKHNFGPPLQFNTGSPAGNFPPIQVLVGQNDEDSGAERVLLLDNTTPYQPFAVDLEGNIIWSSTAKNTNLMTRVAPGGKLFVIADGLNSANAVTSQQLVQEIDLAGNVLRETNATRISEQVVALSGLQSNCTPANTQGAQCLVGWLSHEVRPLANGHVLVLADVERIYTDGTQGSSPDNPIDVLGDMVIDLNANLQVVWYWNSFDHLDVNRAAVLGELCQGSGSCGPLYLQPVANDWLHSNSIYYIPSDGNLIVSMRHQDWVIKIDYSNGTGTGNVIWRMGLGGDFTMNSDDPYPWFSHQHDVQFAGNTTSLLTLFDDGNTRVAMNPGENSRGQVLNVDESTMQVSLAVNADLGVYSPALGSAQELSNGNFHFLPGLVNADPDQVSQNIEVLPDGTIGYNLQNGGSTYRSFRLVNLYTPPTQYQP